MTIAAKILQLNGVKEDIRDAIESFGYDLSNADFTEYAQYICAIGTATTIQITADGTNAGTISDDLTELTNVKTDIKNAIESKGIDLTNVAFSSYAQYIYQIPVGSPNYLKFTANQNGSIGWSSATYPNLEFSKNGDSWATFNDTVNVNTGDYVEFRNNGTAWTATNTNSHFTSTGSFDLSGNIMSLVDNTVQTTTIPITHCFNCLFRGNVIVDSSNLVLPATTLTQYCYTNMFSSCTSLTTAPVLPATTLASSCYEIMFDGCTSLTTAPELPATTLAYRCYSSMFKNCTALTQAPELPATTLAEYCYDSMFWHCTSLTTAPELPATTLAQVCYRYMFSGCTGLTTAPNTLPATTLAEYCYYYMFNDCTSLTTAPELPATTLAQGCYQSMFFRCTALTTAPELPSRTLAYGCYQSMFFGCNGLTTAPALPATTLATHCYNSMFQNCTALTTAPELPATTLKNYCYNYMFYGCTSLNYIKCLATNPTTTSCPDWVNGVPSTGTFVKYAQASWTTGTRGIPSGWSVQNA